MTPTKDQVIADVHAAPSKDRLAAIYAWAAQAFGPDPMALQQIAQACSQRDAFLTNSPVPLPPPPGAQRHGSEVPENFPGSFAPPPGPPPQRQPMPHHEMPAQRPVHPGPGETFETATPRPSPPSPLGQPPGHLARADQMGLGTINATGLGGAAAMDVLRVELVNLAAAAWDLGLDMSRIDGLRDVSAATPEKLWEISAQMLHLVSNWAAQHRKAVRATR